MLFLRKLCRINSGANQDPTNNNNNNNIANNNASRCANGRNNYGSRSRAASAALQQLPNALNNNNRNSSSRQRFAVVVANTALEARARDQLNDLPPPLRRTPPPNYSQLPATPPPSYSSSVPAGQEQEARTEPHRRGDVALELGLGRVEAIEGGGGNPNDNRRRWAEASDGQDFYEEVHEHGVVVVVGRGRAGAAGDGGGGRVEPQPLTRPLEWAEENASDRHESSEATSTRRRQQQQIQLQQPEREQQHQHQHQQQYHRQQRRLQIEQRIANINGSSTESTSSSSEDDDFTSSDGGRFPSGRPRPRQERARRLRDAYCPDLLNACSLILSSPEAGHDTFAYSTSSSSSSSPSSSTEGYEEIDQIRPGFRRQVHGRRGHHAPHRQRLQRHQHQHQQHHLPLAEQARSTPNLSVRGGQEGGEFRQCPSPRRRQRGQLQQQQRGNNLVNPPGERRQSEDEAEEPKNQRTFRASKPQEMGQNLSLRRPRISLTWVLREQQQQQQQQQQDQQQTSSDQPTEEKPRGENGNGNGVSSEHQHNNNGGDGYVIGTTTIEVEPTRRHHKTSSNVVTALRPSGADPLNGYATTPTAHPGPIGQTPKFFSNQNLLDYQEKRDPSKELLFVCTPHRGPKKAGGNGVDSTGDALALAKRRNEIKKRLAVKMAILQANNNRAGDGAEATKANGNNNNNNTNSNTASTATEKEEIKSLKGTYSEPSLIAASEGNHRRHRHRKRRDRNRVQKFGYEIRNVDEFLSKCSLASPGNIPVVLSTSSILYQTRPGGYQMEIPLPLGMVVNAVFKNQNWLYVQTPHAEEGYVGYACCLPLGILPPAARGVGAGGPGGAGGGGSSSKPTPCWESNGDVFPRPCGNMTDSEKEIRLRGGTRSDGARTPRGKRATTEPVGGESASAAGNLAYGEHRVDKLYLRAASQPKLAEKAYAQLRSTKMALTTNTAALSAATTSTKATSENGEYVVLEQQQQQQQQQQLLLQQQQQQQKSKLHVQKHLQQQMIFKQHQLVQHQHQQQLQPHYVKCPPITNGHNGQHLHPSNVNQQCNGVNAQRSSAHLHQSALIAAKNFAQHGQRQTLVAINADYTTESISLQKGEIVTLCECRETKDHRQWFYVKTRDGREGYIPAEVAGHGYL